MQTIETGGLTDEAHEHLRTAMFAAFGRTSDRVKSLVGNTRRLLGHRIEGPNERGNSIEYMTVAYDLTPTVSMYVEMFRSVERHPDDDTWCFDVTMMNYSSDPARRVDLKEFLGKEFNLEA